MFNFIENFLKLRSFTVKVNEFLSDTKAQTETIPQGSVVYPTLFILKINRIAAQLPNYNRFQISLYMNNLQISYRYLNWRTVKRKLRDSINIVEKFAEENGFKFSTSKISMLHFFELPSPPPIELRLGNIRIQNSETVKNLGLVFD